MRTHLLLLLCLLLIVGCDDRTAKQFIADANTEMNGQPVTLKSSKDLSPPLVWLKYFDPNSNTLVYLKAGEPDRTVSMKATQTILLMATTEDPEGANQVRLLPIATITGSGFVGPQDPNGPEVGCTVEALYPTPDISTTPYQRTSNATSPGDSATTRLSVVYQVNGHPTNKGDYCIPTYTWHIYADGTNFSGMQVKTPMLTLVETY